MSTPVTTIKLAFLTDDTAARDVCAWYWQLDSTGRFPHTVAAIAERFGITPSRLSTFVTQHCIAYFADESCIGCGDPRPVATRSELKERQRYPLRAGLCPKCKEAERREAQQKAEEAGRARVAVLQEHLERRRRDYPWVSPRTLAFEDAVSLVSLFRAGGSDDLSYVLPHEAFASALSPSPGLDRKMLDQLYRRCVIAIHPGSRHDAVEFEDGAFTSFLPFLVHWVLPLPATAPSPARYLEDLEALLQSPDEWPDDWREDAAEVHRTIALEECLEYLRVCLEDHGFAARPGEKLSHVMRSVISRFSIGQAYNFIWRAVRDAAAFYVREHTSKVHAVNIVPGSIQRAAERAVAEGWTVKAFRRDRRLPESNVSHVLFTMALKLPDGGLGSVPPRPPDSDSEPPTEDD